MPSQGLGIVVELFFLLCVFGGVLALAYLVTKKLALVRQGGFAHKHMKVVEGLSLGQGQSLYIVEIASEYHLIGVTKEHIEYCVKLDANELHFEKAPEKPFENYLEKWVKGKQEKKDDRAK